MDDVGLRLKQDPKSWVDWNENHTGGDSKSFRLTAGYCTRHIGLEGDTPEILNTSELGVPTTLPSVTGYEVEGGFQIREAERRQLKNCPAVGLAEADSLQHDCNNSHSESVKPRDEAFRGFPGRSPLSIAHTIMRGRRWWNGDRPLST